MIWRAVIGRLRGDGYEARAFRGTALTVLNVGGQNILRLASNLILTRLLFPEAFGIMALVQVVLTGAAMFSDIGIRDSVIRDERGSDRRFLNTAWTLQILRGCLLGAAILLLAGPLARFYETPVLRDILFACALIPVMQGFNSTKIMSANREILLGRMTVLMLASQACAIVVMIALAWWLDSVWALVIGALFGTAMLTVLSHVILPGARDRIALDGDAMRRIVGYGRFIFLATIASYFASQGDKAVLGKVVSLETLAIYNIGFFLATAPLMLAHALTDRVIFPIYSRRPPSESAYNRRKINKARFLLSAFLLGGTGFLALIGAPLVRLLYDARYEGAGPMLALIALATMPMLVSLSYEKLPLASGHSGRYAALMIARSLLQMGLTILGVQTYGVVGVILAAPLSWALTYPCLVLMVRRYSGWDPRHDMIFGATTVAFAASTGWLHRDIFAASGLF